MKIEEKKDSPIVIVGAGGHAKVVIEALRVANRVVLGLLTPDLKIGNILGVPVLGGDDLLKKLLFEGIDTVFVALGDNKTRDRIGSQVLNLGYKLATIVHPSAFVSPSAKIGAGAVVMARAVVGVETWVDQLTIVNTGSILDHDNRLERSAHVAPGCALAGNVKVGQRSLVGVGAAVRPNIIIGSDVVVGVGSSVVADVANGAVVFGSPAKKR